MQTEQHIHCPITAHGYAMSPPWVDLVSPDEAARREQLHARRPPLIGAVIEDDMLALLRGAE